MAADTRGFTASNCTPVPQGTSGSALRRWVRRETEREAQATGAAVYAGLFAGGAGRSLLVMSAGPGAALGPALCRHYDGQRDFLWLEALGDRWVWCLVRGGIPLAEGLASSRRDIEQALQRQSGSLTINCPDRGVQPWLTRAAPADLKLHWLWLETGAWPSLAWHLQLQPASALVRRLQYRGWFRRAVAAGLASPALIGGALLLSDRGAPEPVPLPSVPVPAVFEAARGLPLAAALRECHQLLVALWSRGAASIGVQLDVGGREPFWKLRVTGVHPRAGEVIAGWIGGEQGGAGAEEPAGPFRLKVRTAAVPVAGEGEAIDWSAAQGAHPGWLLWFAASSPAEALLHELELQAGPDWRIDSLSGRFGAAVQ